MTSPCALRIYYKLEGLLSFNSKHIFYKKTALRRGRQVRQGVRPVNRSCKVEALYVH